MRDFLLEGYRLNMSGSALYKTKLCIVYKKNGNCSKPNCTFAHGLAELRLPGESSSFTGKESWSFHRVLIGFLIRLWRIL